MKPEHQQDFPETDTPPVPSELIHALICLRQTRVNIPPAVDHSIIHSAKSHLEAIRPRKHNHRAIWIFSPVAAAACFLLAWLTMPPRQASPPPFALQRHQSGRRRCRDPARSFRAFPHQVKAIVKDETGIQMSLSDEPDVKPSQALVLKICESRGCREIITFSGQDIEIDGQLVTVRDEGGKVTLDGEQFMWTSDLKESSTKGIQIESRRL